MLIFTFSILIFNVFCFIICNFVTFLFHFLNHFVQEAPKEICYFDVKEDKVVLNTFMNCVLVHVSMEKVTPTARNRQNGTFAQVNKKKYDTYDRMFFFADQRTSQIFTILKHTRDETTDFIESSA